MNIQKNEVNEMSNLESEIIETAQHLNSLITLYVLSKNPPTPLEPYYSELCRSLEKLRRIIKSDSQHSETAANVANAEASMEKSDEVRKECLERTLKEDGTEKDEIPMIYNDWVFPMLYNEWTWKTLSEEEQNKIFQDILLTIKENKNPRTESRTSLKDYMKTLKDFYGEITIKTLKDCYDDSFEIKFYTDKIDDNIINTLEEYKDYEVYDVRCEQYCSLPPIDCRIIILDNRKRKPC